MQPAWENDKLLLPLSWQLKKWLLWGEKVLWRRKAKSPSLSSVWHLLFNIRNCIIMMQVSLPGQDPAQELLLQDHAHPHRPLPFFHSKRVYNLTPNIFTQRCRSSLCLSCLSNLGSLSQDQLHLTSSFFPLAAPNQLSCLTTWGSSRRVGWAELEVVRIGEEGSLPPWKLSMVLGLEGGFPFWSSHC